MRNGGCTRRSTVSYCPEEGWIARAPLPAARVGHAMVAHGGKLYRCRERLPSRPQARAGMRPVVPARTGPQAAASDAPGGRDVPLLMRKLPLVHSTHTHHSCFVCLRVKGRACSDSAAECVTGPRLAGGASIRGGKHATDTHQDTATRTVAGCLPTQGPCGPALSRRGPGPSCRLPGRGRAPRLHMWVDLGAPVALACARRAPVALA